MFINIWENSLCSWKSLLELRDANGNRSVYKTLLPIIQCPIEDIYMMWLISVNVPTYIPQS